MILIGLSNSLTKAGEIKLKLVPLKKEYLEFVRKVRNDPQVNKHLFSNAHISKDDQERWYRRYQRDKKNLVFMGVVDVPIGYCQASNIDHVNRSCELGFYVAPEYQNKGYGTMMVKELADYTIGELNMHRLYLEVFADNEKAIKLYRKCGFTEEGILRHKILRAGRFRDVLVMALIAE